MKKIEEFDYINNLFLIYGNLLTEKQKEIVEQYYVYNLSLSEISENINISRSAVSDSLLHAKDNLLKYEEELKIYEKQGKIRFFQVRLLLEENAIGCIYNSMWKGEEVIRTLYFKDYGKTWALTKEELEDETIL